jgi:hypothetical protein
MFIALILLATLTLLGSAQTPNVDYVAYNYRRDYLLTTHNTGNTRKQNRYEGWEIGYDAAGTFTPMVYNGAKYAFSGASADGTSIVPTPSLPVIIKYRFRQNWNQLKNVISVTRTGSTTATYASWSSATSATLGAGSVSLGAAAGTTFNTGAFTTDAGYLNSHIASSPAAPNHQIEVSNTGTRTLTFSPAVERPLMAIASLGSPALEAQLVFDSDFTVISEGAGNWGTGSYTKVGTTLKGKEWNGVIQFTGTVSSLSIGYPVLESFTAFNVGKEDAAAGSLTFRLNTNPPSWTALISKGETQSYTATISGAPVVLENQFFDLKATASSSPLAGDKFDLEWKIVAPCEEPCTCFFCTDEFDDFCPTVEPTPVPTPAEHHEEICMDAWDECFNIEDACFDIDDDCFAEVEPTVDICNLADFCFELADACFAFALHCDLEVEGCPQ